MHSSDEGETWVAVLKRWLQQRLLEPILGMLRTGITPERLAWSLALGFVVGVNPLLGSTTLLALLLATVLRLNLVASQLSNHLVYPLQLALFPLFVRLGSALFGTAALPMAPRELFHQASKHPWDTTRLLWRWEWHAMVVWVVFAAVVAPLVAVALKPLLRSLLSRVVEEEDGDLDFVSAVILED